MMLNKLHIKTPGNAQQADDDAQVRAARAALMDILSSPLPAGAARPAVEEAIAIAREAGAITFEQAQAMRDALTTGGEGAPAFILKMMAEQAGQPGAEDKN